MSAKPDNITHDRDVVAWFEIPAVDFDRAIGFYRIGLNQDIQVMMLNGVRHGIIRNRAGDARGAIVETENPPNGSGPVIYFRSPFDVSFTLTNIESAGGKIIIPKTLIKDSVGDGSTRIP